MHSGSIADGLYPGPEIIPNHGLASGAMNYHAEGTSDVNKSISERFCSSCLQHGQLLWSRSIHWLIQAAWKACWHSSPYDTKFSSTKRSRQIGQGTDTSQRPSGRIDPAFSSPPSLAANFDILKTFSAMGAAFVFFWIDDIPISSFHKEEITMP